MKRRIVITSALPYSNGEIHLGHLLEHLITDFWGRFQKMRGHECLSICADDTHGAPVMVEAMRRGIQPEEQIATMLHKHTEVFREFHINYDFYSTTNTEINRQHCHRIFHSLHENGYLETKEIKQAFCEHDKMFLPDRFVKGTCPKCQTANQYGDSCDACGSVYSPLEMDDARCSLCDNKPVTRESTHYFCKIAKDQEFLKTWVPAHTPEAIANKLAEWLNHTLADWCFTRDAPYFGFALPGTTDKFYYVWFDAPVGYIASTDEWCRLHNRKVEEFWQDESSEIYHNIGKDIIYFHSLFWPVMLKNAGWQLPRQIWVHGMLTIDGVKLSKSRGTFINAQTYLNHLGPEYLRYYFAAKLSDSIVDIDLNWADFVGKVNAELIGKITNIASRSVQMLHKQLDGCLGTLTSSGLALVQAAQQRSEEIASFYEQRQFSQAIGAVREIADEANRFFDEHKPWLQIKEQPEAARQVLTAALHLFRIIAIYLKPVLPHYVSKVETLFSETTPYSWSSTAALVEGRAMQAYEHLLGRIDPKHLEAITAEAKQV